MSSKTLGRQQRGAFLLGVALTLSCTPEPRSGGESSTFFPGSGKIRDTWDNLAIELDAAAGAERNTVRARSCSTGSLVALGRVFVAADIPFSNRICTGDPRGRRGWAYGTHSDAPCPALQPGELYEIDVSPWEGLALGRSLFRARSDGTLAPQWEPCKRAPDLPQHSAWACSASGHTGDPARQCDDLPPFLWSDFDLHVSGTATEPVFSATDCSSQQPLGLWKIEVREDKPPPGTLACASVPGGATVWQYSDLARTPCRPLRPGATYLVYAWGRGRGGATFRVEDGGELTRLGHCGSLAPMRHIAEHLCQRGEALACGTDDLGPFYAAQPGAPVGASPVTEKTHPMPTARTPESTTP